MYGLEDDRVWTAASGFGGGIARHQSICGALSGGVMAIGLQEGHRVEDPKKVADAVRQRAAALLTGFKERFAAIECRNLVAFDFLAPGGYEAHKQSNAKQERCHLYVRYVVETLAREHERQD